MTNVARLLRGVPGALSAMAAGLAVALAAMPPAAATVDANLPVTRAGEWWLSGLQVPAAWRDAPQAGKGVVVAVLSTGVDAEHQDLAGSVTEGPDLGKTGRTPGSSYWGAEGTAVASLIAGHGHGPGGALGITGIAPHARILSVRVTLEYDDPLNTDPAVTAGLPAAIAAGIRYAVSHGANVIALPLDPGNLSAAPSGDPAAGGDAAERKAVSFAIAHNVVLIAPAGDNGAGTNAVNYPAAYPGVIAVGATAQSGQLALFTNTGSYVALTAPGSGTMPGTAAFGGVTANPAAGIAVAAPDGGYESLASSDMSAALTAGTAALIRSRYPRLTVAQVTQALERGAARPSGAGDAAQGWGHGALNAAAALTAASATASAAAHQAPTSAAAQTATPTAAPTAAPSSRRSSHQAAAGQSDPGRLLRSLSVDLVAAACILIALLIAAITLTKTRRRRRGRGPGDAPRASRRPRDAGRPRHARGQGASSGAAVPARVVIWPTTPTEPTGPAAASDLPSGPVTLGITAGSQRRPRQAGNPPWAAASPPRDPKTLPVMLPAEPAEPDGEQRPPWESEPEEFATAPAEQDTEPWPISTTGPMYVWNPAATGPIIVIGKAGEERDDG